MKRSSHVLALLIVAASPLYAGGLPPVTTTPEPATIGLVALGAAAVGIGAWARKRRGR
jgi:hypothetical protein